MATINDTKLESLIDTMEDAITELRNYCRREWDRYTDNVIVTEKYTYEEQLEKGDSSAYEMAEKLRKEINELQELI